MATIHKHPVPADSYNPGRPLNDLLLAQFEHFKHIAKSLPSDLRNKVPAEPSIENREDVERFIAAITGVHLSRKKARPLLVPRPVRRKQPVTLDIAASAETPAKNKPAKSNAQSKPKSRLKRSSTRGSKP